MIYLGFDPGGNVGFGCASLHVHDGRAAAATLNSVDEAIEWSKELCTHTAPIAAGIDSIIFWQTTPSGWRGADEYLRRRYPAVAPSVISPNGLYGAMCIQGIALAMRLRENFPNILIMETHPKVLWYHFEHDKSYPRNLNEPIQKINARRWLTKRNIDVVPEDGHQLDALVGAWAASMRWALDLVNCTATKQRMANLFPVSRVHYFWPD